MVVHLCAQDEFYWLIKSTEHDKVKLPTKKELNKKVEDMTRVSTAIITEVKLAQVPTRRSVGLYESQSDISAMLARKQMMSSRQSAASVRMEKSGLTQARTLALRRKDLAEVRSIDAQLAKLNAANPEVEREDATTDIMAKVNERNRKANLEATRKAEQMEAERRKRERKLAAAARASNSPAPSALAALKTGVPRYATAVALSETKRLTLLTRPVTPNPNGVKPESAIVAAPVVHETTGNFEASIADVEIDLGDF